MPGDKAEKFKGLGNDALQSGLIDEAVRYYTRAIREDPQNEVYRAPSARRTSPSGSWAAGETDFGPFRLADLEHGSEQGDDGFW